MPRKPWRAWRRLQAPEKKASEKLDMRVLTLNTHKGIRPFRRRSMLSELRDAVRATGADVVFLQEVLGSHAGYPRRIRNWTDVPQYEFLADTIWPEYAGSASWRRPSSAMPSI